MQAAHLGLPRHRPEAAVELLLQKKTGVGRPVLMVAWLQMRRKKKAGGGERYFALAQTVASTRQKVGCTQQV